MFDKEYSFRGKHAEMVIKLTGDFTLSNEDGNNAKKHSLFRTNLDVYLLSPIIGFLYNRKADIDTTPQGSSTKIFADKLMNNSDDLNFNYRLSCFWIKKMNLILKKELKKLLEE